MAKKEISLLPQTRLGGEFFGKLFNWTLSVGRYIVIFTELIVILAFLSRFWLDRKNADLSEKIRQQKAILTSSQIFEREFRSFQSRLAVINKGIEAYEPLDPLDIVARNLPPDVLLLDYQYDQDKNAVGVKLKARFFSEAGLAEFIDQLIAEDEIASIQIGTIEKVAGQGGMTTQLRITFNFNNANKQKPGN